MNFSDLAEIFSEIKPFLYSVGKDFLEMYKTLVNTDEFFETNAKFSKKMFDAYVSIGFSEEQAMELLLTQKKQYKEMLKNISVKNQSK